jgi:hypothetical protein
MAIKSAAAKARRKLWHEHYRKVYAQRYRAKALRKYQHRRKLIDKIKLEKGCADCGYNKRPEALDFDHLPGTKKQCDIAVMTSYGERRLMEEIAKCEVVCANCHRIRTADRGQNGPPKKRRCAKEVSESGTQPLLFTET